MSSVDELKAIACAAIDEHQSALREVNRKLWNNPELGFDETYAHSLLADFLEGHGFTVERSFRLETAFRCVYGGSGPGPNVAVLCEYDALPKIGHACGHNLIAEAGVAAALGIKAAMDAATCKRGKLTVLGTPAEEGGGGKVDLIRHGAFDDVDAAMMVHPFKANVLHPDDMLCIQSLDVTYRGKASHAGAAPWEGVNALDAAVTCYQTVSNLRQQMKPSWRVHGIITHGGDKVNVIPERTCLEYLLRAPSVKELDTLKNKVIACINAAATSTGCEVDISFSDKPYYNVLSNRAIGTAYEGNAVSVGIDYESYCHESIGGGATDMGNVSYIVPSIHPMYFVGTDDVMNHTREFTVATGKEEGHLTTIQNAKAMAMTSLDLLYDEKLVQKMKTEFHQTKASQK